MATTAAAPHIHLDEQGRAWVDDTNVKVIEIVLDHLAYGWNAETIHEQHPNLSLAQIYAALTWYYDHQTEMDTEIEQQEQRLESMRAAAPPLSLGTPCTSSSQMSLGLYMDVHVPLPITRGLRRRGVDVLAARDDAATRLPDPDLLDRAMSLGRILFSQDEDLIVEAVRRQRSGEEFATVVFARQLNLSIGRCIADLEALAKAAQPEDAQGQIVFL